MHVTFESKVLRERDELRGCGISARSTVQTVSRMRGGRMHKNRTERERSETQTQRGKNCRKNKKQSFSWKRTQVSWVAKRDTVLHERDRDKVIGQFQRAITLMSRESGGEHGSAGHPAIERLPEHTDPTSEHVGDGNQTDSWTGDN